MMHSVFAFNCYIIQYFTTDYVDIIGPGQTALQQSDQGLCCPHLKRYIFVWQAMKSC